MKVAFELNKTQQDQAAALIKEWWEDYHDSLGQSCFNTNQSFSLEGGRLVYEGERHPLQQDGGLALLHVLSGGNLKSLKVSEYQTSDRRLLWWETTRDYYRRILRDQPEVKKAVLALRKGQDERRLHAAFSRDELRLAKDIFGHLMA